MQAGNSPCHITFERKNCMTTLAELRQANTPATVNPEIALTKPGYESGAAFEGLQRIGKMFASSALVPNQFRGPQNIGNTCIALEMAFRMQASPMMVFQNMYMVQGKPAWSTQFLIACFNQCGRFSALRYEFEGKEGTDSWGCRASATELATGDKITGTLVTIGIAKKEGWFGKGGSKWQTMPEQMLRYRAAAWFIRSVAPEVAMGMYTADELRDVERAEARQYAQLQPQYVAPVIEEIPAPEPKPAARKRKAAVKKEEEVQPAEEMDRMTPELGTLYDEKLKLIEGTPLNDDGIRLPLWYAKHALQCGDADALRALNADAVADVLALTQGTPIAQLKAQPLQDKQTLLASIANHFNLSAAGVAEQFAASSSGKSAKNEDQFYDYLLSSQTNLIEAIGAAIEAAIEEK